MHDRFYLGIFNGQVEIVGGSKADGLAGVGEVALDGGGKNGHTPKQEAQLPNQLQSVIHPFEIDDDHADSRFGYPLLGLLDIFKHHRSGARRLELARHCSELIARRPDYDDFIAL